MCGLIGVAGEVNGTSEKAIRTMLILDSLRGEHSTGVAVVGRNSPDAKVVKQVGDPFQLFGMKDFDKAFEGLNRVVIGHNRYATQGAVNKRNAHPFDFDDLVGAHNGTLMNKYALPDSKDFEVDSENLYHSFQKIGVEETVKMMKGAWALVWWDKNAEEINFLRNKERTLYYTATKNGSQVFWASEAWMLSVALSKHSISHEAIEPFPEDMWLSMGVDKNGKLDKPYISPLKGAEVPVVHYQNRGASGDTFPNAANGNTSGAKATAQGKTATQQIEEARKSGTSQVDRKEVDNRSTLDPTFLRAKGELFEAVSIEKDKYGAEYVVCFSATKPFYQFRLYFNAKHSVNEHLGCEFVGDIAGFNAVGGNGTEQIGYYRIDPWSIEAVVDTAKNYPNHHSKYIGEGEWLQKYGSCCYCTDNVNPEDVINSHAFLTTSGDSICPDCAVNPECMQYVRTLAI